MRELFKINVPKAEGNTFDWKTYRENAIKRMDKNTEGRVYRINKRILTKQLKKN